MVTLYFDFALARKSLNPRSTTRWSPACSKLSPVLMLSLVIRLGEIRKIIAASFSVARYRPFMNTVVFVALVETEAVVVAAVRADYSVPVVARAMLAFGSRGSGTGWSLCACCCDCGRWPADISSC